MTLLDSRIPATLNSDGMDSDEQRQFSTLQAYRALGILMQMTPPDVPIRSWVVGDNRINAHHGAYALTDDEIRASMRQLAGALGRDFTRAETTQPDGMNEIAITGVLNGVRVRIWALVKPCGCDCHSAVTA